jgi:hypothetical protein
LPVFRLIADLLEFQNASRFAYGLSQRRARSVSEQMSAIVRDEHRLTDIAGVGEDLAEKIATLVATGTLPLLEELQDQVPQSVLMPFTRVPRERPLRNASRRSTSRATPRIKSALKGLFVQKPKSDSGGIGLAGSRQTAAWATDQFARASRPGSPIANRSSNSRRQLAAA